MNWQQKTSMFIIAMGSALGTVAFGCTNTAEDCALIGMCGGTEVPAAGGTGGAGGSEMGGAGGMAPPCSESLLSPGAPDMQSAENVHIAPNGTFVVTGNFVGKLVLGPTTTVESAGANPEFFVARYKEDMTIAKAIAITAPLLDSAMDAKGNWLAIGTHSGAVTLPDACAALPDTTGLFIVQFDASDKCVWAKSYMLGAGSEVSAHVAVGTNGDIALAGAFSGSIAGLASTGTLTSEGMKDIFLAKLDPNGDTSWAGRYGETNKVQETRSVAIDSEGNVVLAGDYEGTLNFNDSKLGTMKSGNHAGFVAKFATDGMSVSWQKTFIVDTGVQHVTAMALNGSEVVVAGDINGTSSADKLDGTHRLFLAKLGLADGKITSIKGYAGSGAPKIHDIAVTTGGQMVLTGYLDERLDWGDAELGTGMPGERFFWAAVDKDGTHLRSGGAGDDITGEKRGLGVAVNSTHALVVGHFEGAMSLAGQSRTSSGDKDIFMAELCLP